jgi:ribosome-binding protein aMBF1 (putative translation factor)
MTAQIVEIAGHKMALLPVEEYERLLDIVEDKADVLAAEDAARRRAEGEEYLPAEMVNRILDGESALKVWRQYRGFRLKDLADRVGTTEATISRMESGKQWNDSQRSRALAEALGVSVEDILPE